MDCPKRKALVIRDLPDDYLVEILARVPIRSLCRSKCVAKAWRDVIQDPFHRKRLPQTLQGFFSMRRGLNAQHVDYASLLAKSAPLHMDPSLSFLTKLPGFKRLTFLNSCNGLLVFEHIQESLGYVVCNPTTEQWVEVPRYGPSPSSSSSSMHSGPMYLVFDPAVSCHFHLVQFVWGWEEFQEEGNHGYRGRHHQQHYNEDDDDSSDYDNVEEVDDDSYGYDDDDDDDDSSDDVEEEELSSTSVNVYSSETGQWIHIRSGWESWDKYYTEGWHLKSCCAVLNGMLHFIISNTIDLIAVLDVQGVTRKMVPAPITSRMKRWPQPGYFAQSQGCLHYINKAADAQLSIWVLEDYDTQKWILKHSVSLEPFGRMSSWHSCGGRKKDYSVVAIHPDANVVFIVQNWNRKLKSYDFDHKRVSVIGTLENGTSTLHLVPYVPCFLESPALPNRH